MINGAGNSHWSPVNPGTPTWTGYDRGSRERHGCYAGEDLSANEDFSLSASRLSSTSIHLFAIFQSNKSEGN